jgi:hypothetical protein
MILIALLFAPTVPSAPRPQNLHCTVPFGATSRVGPTSSEVWVTSSTMPTVKWFLGCAARMLSKTARAIAGLNSLEPSP